MPDPTPRHVTVTAICMCGAVWTSRHLSVHPSRTVRIPTCPACQPDDVPAADTATTDTVRSYGEYRERYFPEAVEADRRAAETPEQRGERIAREALDVPAADTATQDDEVMRLRAENAELREAADEFRRFWAALEEDADTTTEDRT